MKDVFELLWTDRQQQLFLALDPVILVVNIAIYTVAVILARKHLIIGIEVEIT